MSEDIDIKVIDRSDRRNSDGRIDQLWLQLWQLSSTVSTMRTVIGPVVVDPVDALAGDIDLLRSQVSRLIDSATRDAVLLLVEGLEAGGAVVSKLGDLLTPQEAAEMMGVSRQYVDKLIQAGRIHAEFKPASSHRVIRTSDVVAFTRKREEGSARVGSTINELIDAGFEY